MFYKPKKSLMFLLFPSVKIRTQFSLNFSVVSVCFFSFHFRFFRVFFCWRSCLHKNFLLALRLWLYLKKAKGEPGNTTFEIILVFLYGFVATCCLVQRSLEWDKTLSTVINTKFCYKTIWVQHVPWRSIKNVERILRNFWSK